MRNRIFDRIGLYDVDIYHTGPGPMTVTFDTDLTPFTNKVNILNGRGIQTELSDDLLRYAGAGTWHMSAEEYGLLISKYFSGALVSPATIDDGRPFVANGVVSAGLGYTFGFTSLGDGSPVNLYTKDGNYNGSLGQWMTFFNGYTAVILLNTEWGLPPAPELGYAPGQFYMGSLMLEGFRQATIPKAFENGGCSYTHYHSHDGCDYDCGSWDPDCNDITQVVYDRFRNVQPRKFCQQNVVSGVYVGDLLEPCAASVASIQRFPSSMVGCTGHVAFDKKTDLCAPGFHVCSMLEWGNNKGSSVPAHHFWTNDNIHYAGSALACTANLTSDGKNGFHVCPTNSSMLVAKDAAYDPENNHVNWFNCGFAVPGDGAHFGGCANTAGALCCKN